MPPLPSEFSWTESAGSAGFPGGLVSAPAGTAIGRKSVPIPYGVLTGLDGLSKRKRPLIGARQNPGQHGTSPNPAGQHRAVFLTEGKRKKGILEAAWHSPKSLILCYHAGRAYAYGTTAAPEFHPHDTSGNSAVNNAAPGRNASRPAAPRSHPASDRRRYAAYFCFHPDSASTHRTPWRCWWPSAPAARRTA